LKITVAMFCSSIYYSWFCFMLLILCKGGHCKRTLTDHLAKGNKSVSTGALSVTDSSCLSRGNNCSFCLSDGNCGFCDTCKDICHHLEAASSPNCSNCARCIPGALDGPKKGHECRVEW
jgi:hypothetical protein